MTTQEFWHEDKRLFNAYQKAYYRKMHENSWTIGLYVNNALQTLAQNILKGKSEKALEYIDKPIDMFEKKNATEEKDIDKTYKELLSNQNDFINNFLKGK